MEAHRMRTRFYDQIPKRWIDEYITHKRQAFAWAYEPGYDRVEHDDRYCSDEDRVGFMLALEGEELVGGSKVYLRTVTFGKQPVELGGIGGLWVREDRRRRGIGSLLVRAVMQKLASLETDVVYLCTDIEKYHDFYSPFGFVPLSPGHTYRGASGKHYVDNDGMLAPVTSPELFKTILQSLHPFDIGRGNW